MRHAALHVGIVCLAFGCSVDHVATTEDLSRVDLSAVADLSRADDLAATTDDGMVTSDLTADATPPQPDLVSTGDLRAPFPSGTVCNDTGTPRTPPTTIPHLIVILFENENFGQVNGNTNAPYISSLATACGYATKYDDNCFSSNLVSLPHYLALVSGSNCNTGLNATGTGCITDDADATSHQLSTASIFSQASSWKSYQEGMPSACALTSGGTSYACKHNPAAYYSALADCAANDIGIATVTCSSTKLTKCTTPNNAFTDALANDTLPALSFITPNLVNDMHDGTVTQGDNWLYTYLPLVFQSAAYLRGDVAVLVLWDEQSTSTFGGATPNLFVSPYITAGTVTDTAFNHFAVLRAMENALGITTYLGCASGTKPGGGACPSGSTEDVRALLGF